MRPSASIFSRMMETVERRFLDDAWLVSSKQKEFPGGEGLVRRRAGKEVSGEIPHVDSDAANSGILSVHFRALRMS